MLALGGDLDAHRRQQLVGLWARGTALCAMGRHQGPVASALGSLASWGSPSTSVGGVRCGWGGWWPSWSSRRGAVRLSVKRTL
ncbi:MAG: hypothetical protein M5U19_12375 [Microthrixaceae bacterium]|nr:hypothetical protein [Microthrixaceae bacterium]